MRRLLALALFALPLAVSAQPLGRSLPDDGRVVSVDLLRGIPTPTGTGALTSIVYVAVRSPLSERLAVHAEVPVGIESLDLREVCGPLDCDVETRVGLANPYLGVEAGLVDGVSAEVGVWLPFATGRGPEESSGFGGRAPSPASTPGRFFDRERPEMYADGVASLSLRLSGTQRFGEAVAVEGAVTPIYSFREQTDGPLTSRLDDRPRGLAVRGEALGAVRLDAADLSAGLVGHYGPDKLFDALDASLVVGAAGTVGGIRPGLELRVPVAGYLVTDSSVILQLSLDVPLR